MGVDGLDEPWVVLLQRKHKRLTLGLDGFRSPAQLGVDTAEEM